MRSIRLSGDVCIVLVRPAIIFVEDWQRARGTRQDKDRLDTVRNWQFGKGVQEVQALACHPIDLTIEY